MCDGCDREVTIGELMEFHAENSPDEDESLRESVLRKMESEEEFDEADDTFLNEVLADYSQKVPMDAPKPKAKKVKFWTRIGQRDKNDRRRYETYEITLDASEATHKKKYQEWYLNWEGGVDGYLTFPNCKSCKAKLLNVFNGEGANEKEIEEVWTDGGPVRDYAELDAPGEPSEARKVAVHDSPETEDEEMTDEEEYEADEEDTVPEEELDVELPQKEEDELEAEVEEAEEEIDEDIEDYDAPGAGDYLKTFAVFAVAASGAIVGIFLTLKGIAALSKM